MIQVYSPGNRKYEKNGNATLIPNAAEIQVKLNGEWELILEHPIDKWGKWAYIREEAVIKAPCFHGEQLFVIRSKTISDSGVEAVAEPIFMEARDDCFLTDVRPVGKQAQVALDMMTAKNTKYSARSDISRTATAYYEYKNLVEAINGDDSNSFIKRWGGEILFNNYEIIINDHIGGDYGFQVLYGKNIRKDGLQEEIDTSEVVTRIYPKAYNGHKMSGDGYVDSTHSDAYPTIKAATIKFDDVKMQEDAQESDAENGVIICKTQKELDRALTIKCQEEFENGIDKPTVKIKADIVMLKNTEEYKDYAILEEVSLGDTVHCKNSKLGIETTARVIGLKYDAIREKVTYVEIGDFSYDYFKTTTTITDRINQVIRPDGSVMADKIAGYIDAAYASLRAQYNVAKKQDVMAILFENLDQESPLYGAMALGTQGLIISKERTADGRDWDWTTAMTANGMIANIIVAGTISDKTGTNFWNLDTGEFALSSRGFTIDGMSASDYFEAAKSMIMQLSNDSQNISVDVNGNYGKFPTGIQTTPTVMYGNQDVTGQCAFSIEKSASILGTWNKDTVTYTVTDLTEDSGWVEIKATFLQRLSVKKRFTVSKLYAGSPGVPGRTYFIEPSTLVLKKGQDNVISPGTVDFKAFYRDGNSASRTAYAGRFKIEETVDGTTWKTIYTSKANESSVKHSTYDYLTDAAGNVIITESGHGIVATVRDIHMIRCTLYAAGGTTNALDTQSVTVVKDVKALTQEEIFNLLTNNGAVKGVYMEDGQLYFSFTYARGGILALGGLNNGNGLLEVYDENGSIIGQWGKNGLETKGKYFTIDEKGNVYSNFPVFQHLYMAYTVNDDPLKYTGMEKYKAEVMRLVLSASPAGSGYGIWLGNENALNTKPIVSVTSRVNFICDKDLKVHGTKSRIVKTREYSTRALYCYEMPSPMFGDIGEAVTDESGVCYIYLDDIFTETINTGIEYQIFLQKEGKGDLWVDSKGPAYFVVKGTPGLKFSWEMKAKQRDYEYERLEDAEITENFTNIINYEEQGQKLFEEYLLEKETAYEESN